MLKRISIENYALIEKSEIDFKDGFSVITGETGAGKSIILGALGLLVGQRADSKVLKDAEKKCVVEALFDVSNLDIKEIFVNEDLDYEDECIIRREILPNGKSRSFVNDTPASVSALKAIGEKLIDIHSQHKNLLLSDNHFQLMAVDAMARNKSALAVYRDAYLTCEADKRKLQKLKEAFEKNKSDKDYLEFQLNQLTAANLSEGEQSDLETEAEKLTHSNEIKEALAKVTWLLNEDESSVNKSLKESANTLLSISSFLPEGEELAQRLNSSMIEVKEVIREIESKSSDVDCDPSRLDFVNARLDEIYTLEKKHNVESVEELISIKDDFEKKLLSIDTDVEEIDRLEKQIETKMDRLGEMAEALSAKRLAVKPQFEKQIEDLLHQMGIANATFSIVLERLDNLTASGFDHIDFCFSANKDQPLRSITDVASGGELSRVMLSLKYTLSQSVNLPTIVLDEIDTGVSGEIAGRMGNIMLKMSEKMQVICITHLPQIASKGYHHYRVYKQDEEVGTTSRIKLLDEKERLLEIAKMVSGDVVTDAAINNAKELLSNR